MINIVLFEPEIPPNTGNIIRLCANSGMKLHLIKPLGFELEDKQLKRAGLDYHEYASLTIHEDWSACTEYFSSQIQNQRVFFCTTKAQRFYTQNEYQAGDVLVFGPETRGIPMPILTNFEQNQWLKIPMKPESRSLNLSNAVAIISFEALRQLNFEF